jgi:hypothetical protein
MRTNRVEKWNSNTRRGGQVVRVADYKIINTTAFGSACYMASKQTGESISSKQT